MSKITLGQHVLVYPGKLYDPLSSSAKLTEAHVFYFQQLDTNEVKAYYVTGDGQPIQMDSNMTFSVFGCLSEWSPAKVDSVIKNKNRKKKKRKFQGTTYTQRPMLPDNYLTLLLECYDSVYNTMKTIPKDTTTNTESSKHKTTIDKYFTSASSSSSSTQPPPKLNNNYETLLDSVVDSLDSSQLKTLETFNSTLDHSGFLKEFKKAIELLPRLLEDEKGLQFMQETIEFSNSGKKKQFTTEHVYLLVYLLALTQ